MLDLKNTVLLFIRVALFKSPPQELPASSSVLAIAIAMSLMVGVARYLLVGAEFYSVFRIFLELVIPGVLLFLLLSFYKFHNRFSQTFAAICGSGAIIYALAMPVLPSFFAAAESPQRELSVYLIIAIDLWSVAVLAHILRHAVNVGLATGISLAVGLVLGTLFLVEGISPARQSLSADQKSDQELSIGSARGN